VEGRGAKIVRLLGIEPGIDQHLKNTAILFHAIEIDAEDKRNGNLR
jgi:hypothetical protein